MKTYCIQYFDLEKDIDEGRIELAKEVQVMVLVGVFSLLPPSFSALVTVCGCAAPW